MKLRWLVGQSDHQLLSFTTFGWRFVMSTYPLQGAEDNRVSQLVRYIFPEYLSVETHPRLARSGSISSWSFM